MENKKILKEIENNNLNENNINNNNDNINPNILGNEISIKHYVENQKINKIIDSPRTLKSMDLLGCTMDDIYYLTLPEFIESFQDFRRFPKYIQIYLYNAYEKNRLMKIEMINEKRNYIIQNNININDNFNLYKEENHPLPTFSSSIKKELAKFEQMKKKNELDLIKAIETELERQILLKEEETKMRRNNMKKDEFQKRNEINRIIKQKELENRENRKYIQEKERTWGN